MLGNKKKIVKATTSLSTPSTVQLKSESSAGNKRMFFADKGQVWYTNGVELMEKTKYVSKFGQKYAKNK
jgi:hypothetical protein